MGLLERLLHEEKKLNAGGGKEISPETEKKKLRRKFTLLNHSPTPKKE